MAKLRDLIAAVAELTHLEPQSVETMARELREAGLIQTGASGRYGGADMSAQDTANLLIARLAGRDPIQFKYSAETVALCSPMVVRRYLDEAGKEREAPERREYFGLGPTHRFGMAMTAFVATAIGNGLFDVGRLDVEFERSPWPKARVDVWGIKHLFTVEYQHPARSHGKTDAEAIRQALVALDTKFGGRPGIFTVKRSLHITAFRELGARLCLGLAIERDEALAILPVKPKQD